jgi:hypothetical protein
MNRNGPERTPHEPPRRAIVDSRVRLAMVGLLIVALGTIAALWLPQLPVRLALTVVNALVVLALLAMLIRRRR